jgi:UDP-N-acetylmuramoyl-tripeptide--D-alanyl-D-alanine ligase
MKRKALVSDFIVLKNLLTPRKIYNLYFFKPVKCFSLDTRSLRRGDAFIALRGKYKDGHRFIPEAIKKGARLIIAERNTYAKRCKVPFFVVEDSYRALEVLARFVRREKNPFVYAITGSVGKTTTKEMLSFLLSRDYSVCRNHKTENNILGVAKTIFSLQAEAVLILELGTNAPGEMRVLSRMSEPDVGVITFIKPVHLERFKTLTGVFKEKAVLFKGSPRITAVLNRDDPYLRRVSSSGEKHWFGQGSKASLRARLKKRTPGSVVFLINEKFELTLPRQYEHFIHNALAAILAASLKKIPLKALIGRMNRFRAFPEGRMQWVRKKGFAFLHDAYNANPYALQQALKVISTYPQQKVAVLGDMLELGKGAKSYHAGLAKGIISGDFLYCLTIGRYMRFLQKELKKYGYTNGIHLSSSKAAASFLREKVPKGTIILLKGSRSMALEKIIDLL